MNIKNEDVKALVNLDTLYLEKESFVTKELRNSVSDILFSVKFGDRDGFLYLLLEHQSKPDHFMAFRIFKYMFDICEQYLNKNKDAKHLPLVYPMIFYNGKQQYNVARNLWDLFSDPPLAKKFWADKDYQLINAHSIDDEELREHYWAGTLQFFMKNVFDRKILDIWEEIKNTLPEIIKVDTGHDFLRILLTYSLTRTEENDKIKIKNLLTKTLGQKEGEDVMVSVAQKLYSDGKAEGKAEGKARGRTERNIEIAKNMLAKGIDVGLISSVTGLDKGFVLTLKH